jgi:hypothetical protein
MSETALSPDEPRMKTREELLTAFHVPEAGFDGREASSRMQATGWKTIVDGKFSTLEEVFYVTEFDPKPTSRTFQTKKDLGAVTVLLYDPVADKIVMIREPRIMGLLFGDSGLMLECPTGSITKGATILEDQHPDDAARDEATQETRCTTSNLICVQRGSLESAGWMDARNNLYVARVDIREIAAEIDQIRGNQAEGEYIRAEIIDPEQLAELWMQPDAKLNLGTYALAGAFIQFYQEIRQHFLNNPAEEIVETLAEVLGPRAQPSVLLRRLAA